MLTVFGLVICTMNLLNVTIECEFTFDTENLLDSGHHRRRQFSALAALLQFVHCFFKLNEK